MAKKAQPVRSPDQLMTASDAAKIRVGDKLRMLVGGCGGVYQNGGAEWGMVFRAGEIVTVNHVERRYNGPLVAIASANGVCNTFYPADFKDHRNRPIYPFVKVAHGPSRLQALRTLMMERNAVKTTNAAAKRVRVACDALGLGDGERLAIFCQLDFCRKDGSPIHNGIKPIWMPTYRAP